MMRMHGQNGHNYKEHKVKIAVTATPGDITSHLTKEKVFQANILRVRRVCSEVLDPTVGDCQRPSSLRACQVS